MKYLWLVRPKGEKIRSNWIFQPFSLSSELWWYNELKEERCYLLLYSKWTNRFIEYVQLHKVKYMPNLCGSYLIFLAITILIWFHFGNRTELICFCSITLHILRKEFAIQFFFKAVTNESHSDLRGCSDSKCYLLLILCRLFYFHILYHVYLLMWSHLQWITLWLGLLQWFWRIPLPAPWSSQSPSYEKWSSVIISDHGEKWSSPSIIISIALRELHSHF